MRVMAELDDIDAGARKSLNTHGHSFAQALVHRLAQLRRGTTLCPYRFLIAEYPVEIHGQHTAIDLILENVRVQPNQVVIGECKRVDPKVGRWIFARTPFTRAGDASNSAFVSGAFWATNAPGIKVQERTYRVPCADPYHLGFEQRTNRHGDGVGHDGKTIEQAVKQVFQGTAGLLQTLGADPDLLLRYEEPLLLIPVIFTTAEIFVVEDDISTADLASGDLDAVSTVQEPWIWYQANLSRNLRPALQPSRPPMAPRETSLERTVVHRHTRAAMIVSLADPKNLFEFIKGASAVESVWV